MERELKEIIYDNIYLFHYFISANIIITTTILKEKPKEGACFPIIEIDESIRLQYLLEVKKQRNHTSVEKHEEYLASAFKKEVEKGWILLLPDEEATHIPSLELAPMGVTDQLGISATGEFVSKLRITHDLSFPQLVSGESVNSRVEKEKLEPCMFGHTLLRIFTSYSISQKEVS